MKLDEQLEIDTTPSNTNESSLGQKTTENLKNNQESGSVGISIENASYIENNLELENKFDNADVEDEYTQKLFSEEDNQKVEENPQNDKLFDQNSSDDEEFEIPAFLRKQKF